MNLKFSGLLFVLIVVTEAINGLEVNSTSISKNHTQDLPAITSQSEKSQKIENEFKESVKVTIPKNLETLKPKDQNTVINAPTVTTTTTLPPPSVSPVPSSPSPPSSPSTSSPSSTPSSTPPSSSTTPSSITPSPSTMPQAPTPAPEKDKWVVWDDKTKKVCIIFKASMKLNITYPGKSKEQKSAVIYVPKNASATGSCNDLQFMNITWEPGFSLQINFTANKSSETFYIKEFMLTMNATVLKDIDVTNTNLSFVNQSSKFITPLDMSYKCDKMQDLYLKNKNENLKAVLSLNGTQIEAFVNKTKPEFGAAQDCETFDTPDVVPIAVGCALAILVLVVLTAYIIGRKRSQNRGYLSM